MTSSSRASRHIDHDCNPLSSTRLIHKGVQTPGRNREDQKVNHLTPEPVSGHQDDTDNTESTGHKARGVDELPDGSGSDTQGVAPEHGQESRRETFEAG